MKIFKELELLGFFEWLAEMHNLRDTDMKPKYLDELPLNDIHLTVCNSMAFRWFREKYGLEIILRPDTINAPEKKLREYVILSYDKSWVLEPIAEPHWWIRKGLFNTYEKAELSCLKKLIEIVKQPKQ